jgi:hypothetical protein
MSPTVCIEVGEQGAEDSQGPGAAARRGRRRLEPVAATFAEHLQALDDEALASLLTLRREVCTEPLPADFSRLADRLCTSPSLVKALCQADSDAMEVARAVVVLGSDTDRRAIADLLDAEADLVDRAVDRLVELGMVWPDGARLRLPDRLVEHFSAGIGGSEEINRLARAIRVEELKVLADAHGVATAGLRKPELVTGLAEALADRRAVADRIRALDARHQRRLLDMLVGEADRYTNHLDNVERALMERGIIVQAGYRMVVPREVAIAAWLTVAHVAGPPTLPPTRPDTAAAAGAAQEFLRHARLVLDHARSAPIAALKSGGIGKRERSRLVKSLELPDDEQLTLVIDLASATGLLGAGSQGYTTTDRYPAWRAAPAARRWATLVDAWYRQPHASVRRVDPDGTELTPPLASTVDSSALRHALVRATRDGGSLSSALDRIDWFAPFFDTGSWRDATVAAAVDEAVRLGLAEGDGLTPLGRALGSVDAPALAEAAEPHLGDVACQVLLQSDLTAVVTGTPDDAGLGLLSDAADVETRGAATVYRFSPGAIRRALDGGWSAEGLLAGLRSLSGTDLPQPLDYLVRDAARVHGSIRVHDVRTCVIAEESIVEELAHARTLRKLGWRRLTPTVLASAEPPQVALSLLRGAGYSPVLDDGSGAVAVERTEVEPVAPDEPIATSRIDPAEVVRRLRVTPDHADSTTMVSLAQLNGRLSADELDLLAHALDHQEPVHITYRVTSGTVTERAITPTRLMHRWLISWCHLRNDDREFTVSSILAVRPA